MIHRIPVLIAAIFFLSSCGHQQQVKAKIFERKEISENRLMIKYKYMEGSKTYIDSASVKNIVIGNDSINVIINPRNPGESMPDL